ncbi:MAG TPA: sugar transferase [Candidatus Woesebacteria bacterium]|jgi:exopolysaccharide production protein ExoY|nr:sugar transferase [Candidatus Woesebacteria bacterium]
MLKPNQHLNYYEVVKRVIDIIVASMLIVLFTPFWIIVPILIVLDSGRPAIFKHKRVGRFGKEFELYKFRSMVRDADDLLHKHDSKLLEEFKNGDWKMRNDPRVTLVGKILRKLTIDEFPQLINVMRGEMSMVGPRAYLRKELEEQTKRYPETKQYLPLILAAKPGITGVWQTSGRNEIPFTKRAKIDSEYAQHQSITEDLLIILRTPKAMLSKW